MQTWLSEGFDGKNGRRRVEVDNVNGVGVGPYEHGCLDIDLDGATKMKVKVEEEEEEVLEAVRDRYNHRC
eukprot:scaffold41813_cov365-Skeletonema_marinoi.AAC.2